MRRVLIAAAPACIAATAAHAQPPPEDPDPAIPDGSAQAALDDARAFTRFRPRG